MRCYPEELSSYPEQLKQLLQTHSSLLHPDVRIVRFCLVILVLNIVLYFQTHSLWSVLNEL